jgi:TRAP-type C4-dicarboxylate transport system substrate-binding protein
MRSSFKVALAVGSLVAAVTLTPAQAQTQTTHKLTLATGQPPVFPYIALLRDFFIPEVDKRLAATSHRIQWTQAYSGTVMKIGSEIESVKEGIVDIAFVLFPNNISKLPLHSFTYFLPFSSTDAVATVAAFNETQRSIKRFGDVWDRNNHVYLATVAIESFNLYSKRPVRSFGDLKGMKVGVIGPNAHWLRNTGAVPVTLNLPQIATDLQNGIYEAALMGDSVGAAIKINEPGPFRTQFDVGAFVFAGVTINKDRWNGLPPQVREIISAVATEYERNAANELIRRARQGVDGMKQAGLTNIEISTAGRAEWANAMPNIARDWADQSADKKLSEEIISTYLDNLRKNGQQPIRNWAAQ